MKLAGIFSGMGSQWPSMAQTLLPHWPVYGQELAKLDVLIQQQFGWSVSQLLENADAAKLAKPDIANPCIFAVQLALFRQLQALGLHFDMVLGHSTGEFAAACAAGVLREVDALQLMHSHNQLIELASQQTGYAMAQLTLTDAELVHAQQLQPDLWQGVVVAAQNSPQTQIVSGPELQLQSLVQAQQTQQRFARLLSGAVPFHSPYLPEFTTEVPQIEPQQAAMALYSSLRGRQLAAAEMDTTYWQQHIRQPVRFYSAVQQMLQDGADCLLEIAPHHILLFSLHDI
ncbi:MAG: acyltransferase domain-containing protein, partial [Gammaproteobacteria bacterium]|nr:acyltransferase domain-containing protein [Gammaproteobacteria bacterium]